MAHSQLQQLKFVWVILIFALVGVLFPAAESWAQTPIPTCGKFGCFEVLDQLPIGGINKNIDEFAKKNAPIVTTANILFQLGLAGLVMISLIIVVIGGYKYMTAGGDGKKIESAKMYVTSALTGMAIGFIGWLILNTVSPQFTQPSEPTINLPPTPTI